MNDGYRNQKKDNQKEEIRAYLDSLEVVELPIDSETGRHQYHKLFPIEGLIPQVTPMGFEKGTFRRLAAEYLRKINEDDSHPKYTLDF